MTAVQTRLKQKKARLLVRLSQVCDRRKSTGGPRTDVNYDGRHVQLVFLSDGANSWMYSSGRGIMWSGMMRTIKSEL